MTRNINCGVHKAGKKPIGLSVTTAVIYFLLFLLFPVFTWR
jgi:hypothetical protein